MTDADKMLLDSFFIEGRTGGMTCKIPTKGWWYEEYAEKGGGHCENESDTLRTSSYMQLNKEPLLF